MNARLSRIGMAVAMAVMAFVLLSVLSILMSSDQRFAPLQDVVPQVEPAEARIIMRIISPDLQSTLELFPNQRLMLAVGHIHCDAGEQLRVDVTITQNTSGAVAEGHRQDFCTGEVQEWTVRVLARRPIPFALGPAQACAVAVTRTQGKATDAFSWCKAVTLTARE